MNVTITPNESPVIEVVAPSPPIVGVTTVPQINLDVIGLPGEQGPPGPPGPSGADGTNGVDGTDGVDGADALWTALTQSEYDALLVKDPAVLYVIVPAG